MLSLLWSMEGWGTHSRLSQKPLFCLCLHLCLQTARLVHLDSQSLPKSCPSASSCLHLSSLFQVLCFSFARFCVHDPHWHQVWHVLFPKPVGSLESGFSVSYQQASTCRLHKNPCRVCALKLQQCAFWSCVTPGRCWGTQGGERQKRRLAGISANSCNQ